MWQEAGRRVAVRFADCVAVLRWRNGTRSLFGSDGLVLSLEPDEWRDGRRAMERIDAEIADERVVCMDDEVWFVDDPDLRAGIEALEAGEFDRARELLERGVERSPAPSRLGARSAGSAAATTT